MAETAFCTIITKNYLAWARTMADSILRFHPHADIYVLVIDHDYTTYFNPSKESFIVIGLTDLDIPDIQQLCFQHTAGELSRVLKPFFLLHVLKNYAASQSVYLLDSDILVTDSLSPAIEALAQNSIVFTPQITRPISAKGRPTDTDILLSGTYSSGFIGVKNDANGGSFLNWWQAKVREYGFLELDRWQAADQKWLDLVPTIFQGVHVLSDPGYNARYWNIGEMSFAPEDDNYRVRGQRLRFFHFSGYTPDRPHIISTHQHATNFRNRPDMQPLFSRYQRALLAHNYQETHRWPYVYDRFDNGVYISPIIRRAYYSLASRRGAFSDPFQTEQANSFFNWLKSPAQKGSNITNLQYRIYKDQPELWRVYPDVPGRDSNRFLSWFYRYGAREFKIDDIFLSPLTPHPEASIPFTLHQRELWRRLDHFPLYISALRFLHRVRQKINSQQ